GTVYNSQSTNIIIRFKSPLAISLPPTNLFVLTADGAKIRSTESILKDGKTVIIHPNKILPADAKINVNLASSLTLSDQQLILPFSYYFNTNGSILHQLVNNESQSPAVVNGNPQNFTAAGANQGNPPSIQQTINSQMPLTVMYNSNTNSGYYFVSTINYSNAPNRCMILDSKGKIVFDRKTPYYALDFTQLSNGNFSYYNWKDTCYLILDQTFTVIDTIKAGNGYLTDNHELQYDMKTKHYFLLAQEYVRVDMSMLVAGGNSNAMVLGLIIQEIDENGNVVFEWKTLDHLPITDCVGQNLTASTIDYIHCNAICVESDSSVLLSSRHLNEIERISRTDGRLIWRMGLNSNGNMFSFMNDKMGFSYQHDIRRLPNGHITLFDNGNYRPVTGFSRAVEYEIDEHTMTVNEIWEYRNNPDVGSSFMGSVQRLPNGNTLIGWGGASPTFTEVDANGNKVFEVALASTTYSYRAFNFDISNIVKSNQVTLVLNDTTVFCNTDKNTVYGNLPAYLSIPASIPDTEYEIINKNDQVTIFTQSANNFFKVYNTYLSFDYNDLIQKDTQVCEGNSIKLNVSNNCTNAKIVWSTSDTTTSITVTPKQNTKYYVDVTNGNYHFRDSISIAISKIPDFSVLGQPTIYSPYEIHTYSVPYSNANTYSWNVLNGNVISGFNSNAASVEWGTKDTGSLTSIITNNYGCSKQSTLTVLMKKATGLSSLSASQNLKVYPNPTTDELNIELQGEFEYKMYDVAGRLVSSSFAPVQNSMTLATGNINPGYYLLDIISKGKSERIKIIKN
ncbi:MAG: aryl-sulfate sulfotransferase, partial [Bacteroidia bacterium]